MVKSPLSARVIFNIDEGEVNVLDIARKHPSDYFLGTEEVTVFVVKEFHQDFVDELDDVRHDPIEVTLCRNVKKDLLKSLDGLSGGKDDESYWATCEEEHVNLYADVYMENGRPGQVPLRPPQLPPPDKLRDESFELRGQGKRAKWMEEQGYLVMLCLDPRNVPIRPIGPGHRTLRWTAVREDDEWKWRKKESQGPVDTKVFEANSAMVFYAWDKPETLVLAEGHDLSVQEQRAVLRSHVNLGHPGRAEFVRLLKAAGCRNDIIQYVQREFRCAGCDLEQRPPTRLPAATPRCYDFNVVIGIDVLFIHGLDNKTEHPVLNVTCLGALYSTFGLIDPLRRSAKLTLKAFERLWVRTFGPPDFLLYDMGTEFTGSDFQSGIERMCIQPIVCDQEASWENGVCERRGDLFKKVYYKSREIAQPRDMDEVELLVFESSWALQTSVNRSGFTPAQRVLGRQPRVALDLASDDKHYELSVTQDKAWTRAAELRQAARKALMELDAKERVQRASRARPRRQLETKVFSEGQPVVVWRQGRRGALSKVGPCYVILQRGSTVWVSRRGELWKCNASQVFEMGPLEVQGLEVIPRDLLMAKERLRFDSEKLGFVDVSQENADEGDLGRSPLDGSEDPPAGLLPPQSDRAVPSESPAPPGGAGDGTGDLPSDLEGYSPDAVQTQAPQSDGAVPSESAKTHGRRFVHEPLVHAKRTTVTGAREQGPLQSRPDSAT